MADSSAAYWLAILEPRLHARWDQWSVYDAYYEGDHRFSQWLRSVQRTFSGTVLGNLLNGLTDNYMPLVVDSAAERLRVQGFRFGDSEDADNEAWDIWQANGLDGQSNMVHTESIKLGEAYWMVTPNGDEPLITAEHPSQVIVAHAPGNRRRRLAALKKWREDEWLRANVYLPDRVVKFRAPADPNTPEYPSDQKKWQQIEATANPLEVVPVIPMPNNPSMLRGGRSDLAGGAISLQDQITKTVADLLIGSEYHGLPQRVLLGVEAPRDENGRTIPFETAAKSRLWYFNSKDAKAHEFSQADLKGLRESADGFIGDLAAQTRIPIYYFRPAAISNISAEALIGLDAGLVSKTNDKKEPFSEGHEEAMRLAFKSIDASDPRAEETSAETIWADTESRSEAQRVDAVTKLNAIGMPLEACLEELGYSPQKIDRIMTMADNEAFLSSEEPVGGESTQPDANRPV